MSLSTFFIQLIPFIYISVQDSWAICRIFKKANSNANRALSHTWAPSLSETTSSDAFTYAHFSPENDFFPHATFYKNPQAKAAPADVDYFPSNLVFSDEASASGKSTVDLTSMFFSQSAAETETCKNSGFEAAHHQFNGGGGGYSVDSSSPVIQANGEEDRKVHNVWENIRSMGFPFSLPPGNQDPWESPPCPSEMSSTTYSTNKCYI